MNRLSKTTLLSVGALLGSFTNLRAQGPLPASHPSFDMTSVRPTGFNFSIGAMDWMPDGRLLVATYDGGPSYPDGKRRDGYPSDMYFLSGVETGDKNKVTFKKATNNLGVLEPLGLMVLDGDPYVTHKHQFMKLEDTDHDGVYDKKVEIAKFSNLGPGEEGYHQFNYGVLYKEGFFYVTTNGAWPSRDEGNDRGAMISIEKATGKMEILAKGLRSPSGMNWGPDGDIFVSDNQGNWQPANKINNIRPGRTYGMRHLPRAAHPMENQPESPPAVWLPQGAIANSPTQPIMIPKGSIYEGQLLAGDIFFGGMQRFSLDKVKNEWQGAAFRFAGGFEAGIMRLLWGKDGSLYAAGLGGNPWHNNWQWKGKYFALDRMKPNGKVPFEMLAVRARKGGLEIEFTKAVEEGPVTQPANYSVKQWQYIAEEAYGAGKQPDENLSVKSAELSPDKKSVYLAIDNLKEKRVVYINVNRNIKAATGESVWYPAEYKHETWYTLNFFSDSEKFTKPPVTSMHGLNPSVNEIAALFETRISSGNLYTRYRGDGRYEVSLFDNSGSQKGLLTASGAEEQSLSISTLPSGVYHLRVKAENKIFSKSVVIP